MCTSKPKTVTPAAAPPPPLEPADAPDVGEARRKETEDNFGSDAPTYRVNRRSSTGSINPNGPITM